MSTRLDQSLENVLATKLDGFESHMNELKSGSQFVGTSNLLFTTSDTGSTYDWSGLLSPGGQQPGAASAMFTVTATANKMNVLYGDLIVYLYKDSMSNWYRPSNFFNDQAANVSGSDAGFNEGTVAIATLNKKSWNVWISGNQTSTYFLKVYVVASDSVTIAVTPA